MTRRNTEQLSKNVYWIGIRDWNRRLFDALIPLPEGTTYNSYLVMGDAKRAVIDTVNPGFEKVWEQKMRMHADPEEIDYVIMNHAEPDHAGSIPHIMAINGRAKLVATATGAKMAENFFGIPHERIRVVRHFETLELGEKTLQFVEAPMLHWPETMFTYLKEDKILFPCDFFGLHVAKGVYSDEVPDMLVWAQRYFGEIMMPFAGMAQKALEKIKNLDINMIAPSHGPVHKDTRPILESYRRWCQGETRPKVTIVYATMWNSTEKMIQPLAEELASEGVEVSLHNLAFADIANIAKDLVDSRALVLGSPTVLGGAHPLAVYAAYLVKALRPPAKYAVVLGSYGWGGGMIRHLQEVLGPTKMEIIAALEINGPPTERDIQKISEYGKLLADKVKAVG